MDKGTVSFFNSVKGFGFIKNDETGEDTFVHFSGIQSESYKSLGEGSKVIYEVERDPKSGKERAINVHIERESIIILAIPEASLSIPRILSDTIFVNKNFLSRFSNEPNLMHDLTSRQFEELIAEIYRNLGYEVELTKATRDGGKDIYIAHQNELGSFLYIVECKKYAISRPVGVDILRNVYGTLRMDERNPNAAIICTTSRFTNDVTKEIELKNLKHHISLQDFNRIKELLNQIC